MHVLISPNAFKNSLNAEAAAHAIEKGLKESSLSCTTACFPIGDGGDGTGSLLTKLLDGTFIEETVHDPLGRMIKADFGLIDDGQAAVIEMASASGLRLLKLDEYDPLHASSYGTGELMKKALDKGSTKIILCVGGSATVDGGCGILQALGIRFLDGDANELNNMPETLVDIAFIDIAGLDKRMTECECIILCDVANTLLGDKGAAKIFGPQKGASEKDVEQLEASLAQFNKIVLEQFGIDMSQLKHGGAAGGTVAGLHALLKAKPVNGIDHFLDITGFDKALGNADLLITGEGSIDLQTLEGKAPYGVAVRAKKKSLPVIALAGNIPPQPLPGLNKWFDRLLNINQKNTDIATAIAATAANLTMTARKLGDELASQKQDH
ncbi:MAG: glycerate kinase [Bacteroidota bacterium]